MTPSCQTRPKRSAMLIILSVVTLVDFSAWLAAFACGIGGWDYLGEIAPAVLPVYLAISGMIWAADRYGFRGWDLVSQALVIDPACLRSCKLHNLVLDG